MDQPVQVIAFGKPIRDTLSMFVDSLQQVGRHANIGQAFGPVGHDVDAGLEHHGWIMNAGGPETSSG